MAITVGLKNPYAVLFHVSLEVSTVFAEYLESSLTLGEVLENKPASLRQQVLTELAVYFDIRECDGYPDVYFKKESSLHVLKPQNAYSVLNFLTAETSKVYEEYLISPFSFDEVLENKPAHLRQRVRTELAVYFDIRECDGQSQLFFKKEF